MKAFYYRISLLSFFVCMILGLQAQYSFSNVTEVACTEVKSQDRTGTCWSFATASFIESELIRMGKGYHDLSEMHVVRNIYKDKAMNYVLRQGKANFSQGSLSHDLMRSMDKHGIIPQSEYTGHLGSNTSYDHSEMEAVLKGMLDGVIKQKRISSTWKTAFDCVLDSYMGSSPENFSYNGKNYNPQSFSAELGINADDYVSITSFTHHPFYKPFILEIPDNYSNGSFYNVPLDQLEEIVDHALQNGYSIAWDGDVSESSFSSRDGIAVLPAEGGKDEGFKTKPVKEISVNQKMRQEGFESFATTDDHLMHLVGSSKDQSGNIYYKIKNSWGEISDYKGYLYMSKAYVRMKTISIMVHKDAIPKNIAQRLEL